MALRNRDKKGYPQFVGRIIEWKYSKWKKEKVELVRVVGFDYHVGVTFVNVNDNTDNFTCLNGPLSPERVKHPRYFEPIEEYDRWFQYALEVLRTNSIYDVDVFIKRTGINDNDGGTLDCAFDQ